MRRLLQPLILSLLPYLSICQSSPILESLNEEIKSMGCLDRHISDSLIQIIIVEAEKIDSRIQLGKAFSYKARNASCEGDYVKAVSFAKRSLSFFEKENEVSGEARAINHLASAYRKLHKIDSALIYCRRMGVLGELNNDSTIIAMSANTIASAFIESHLQDSALFYALKALEISESMKSTPEFIPAILHNIAISYNMEGDLMNAKSMYLKSEKKYEESNYRQGMPISIYNNLGRCLVDLEQYDSAILIYKKGLKKNSILENGFMEAYINRGLGRANWLKGDQDQAIKYTLISKEVSERHSLQGNLVVVLSNLTKYYSISGDHQRAIDVGLEGLSIAEETGNQGIQKSILENLTTAYEHAGNINQAYKFLKDQVTLNKELDEKARSNEFLRLQTQYETEKKESQIRELSQESQIQELNLRQKNQMILIGIVAFILVLAVIYFFNKQQSSKKQQLQTALEQRFLRSQLNPHFISNALVAVQSFMLKNDSESASLYLTKFSKLMREILENSRKEFIPIEEEINMLKNYMDIHQQRLGSFEYAINLDDAIDPEVDTIPPMFVQPFVENAVEHGIGNIQTGGRIELRFKKEGDFINISVNDNGQGLSQASDSDHRSLSTTIIRERMDLFNRTLKNKIQLVIDNLRNEDGEVRGTKVELKVPFGI